MLNIHYEETTSPSVEDRDAMYELFEANMRRSYEEVWGEWDPIERRRELDDGCFVIARADSIVGFALVRFEKDEGRSVLYVWELQVKLRRCGIGTKLMDIVEAKAVGQDAVMLTVFKSNEAARRFYEKRDYRIDADDPSNYGEDDAGYFIMSKRPPRKRRACTRPA